MTGWMRRWLLLLACLFPVLAAAVNEDELLLPEQAFRLQVTAPAPDRLRAAWTIAPGYYLYGEKFRFKSDTPGIRLGEPRLPPGQVKDDEFFGKVTIHHDQAVVDIPVERDAGAPATLRLTATSQGCAEVGVCYPPQHVTVEVALPAPVAAPAAGGLAGLEKNLALAPAEDEVLDPDVAFRFDAAVEGGEIVARWQIAPDHYLYRDKFTFQLQDGAGLALGAPRLPAGEEKNDEFFGRIQVFHHQAEARLPLSGDTTTARQVTLVAGYQGCAEVTGVCYPPQRKEVTLEVPAGALTTTAAAPAGITPPPLSEQDSLAAALAGGDAPLTLLTFFGLGLLLAFTPCVFPMVPILSSIIVGHGHTLTTRKAFTLSLVYVLAMALTYTVAGVIAGLFGANLQATFQNPWILGTFAALFVALAFSMFGFYELQLPSALQSRLSELSNRQQGGSLTGVAVMGLLSALIVGPCVAPPLMGALIYIGQTGDAVLGGMALFALSMGMGAPLLAIGTSAGKLLPRAGGWMEAVKAVFGVLMLAVAVWMLERILPAVLIMVLWALLLIGSAVYMGALEPIREGASGWRKLWKGLGLALLVHGALLLIGAAGGGTDPLQPLRGVGFASGGAMAGQPAHLTFRPVKTVADLEREVARASAAGQAVMLDFYADWCVSCKEFEKYTFADAGVMQALSGVVLLQADVTANDEADQALLRHFRLIGPPAILFFGTDSVERKDYRVVGFMEAAPFRDHIAQALGR